MNEARTSGNVRRMGMMIPLVLFVLGFVLCCGVLAGVFLRAAAINARAGDCTAGVQLCRNTAELCRSGQGDDLSVRYYDEKYGQTEKTEASYYVTVICREEPAGIGILRVHTITAYNMEAEPLYTLEAAVYLPEGEAHHEH